VKCAISITSFVFDLHKKLTATRRISLILKYLAVHFDKSLKNF